MKLCIVCSNEMIKGKSLLWHLLTMNSHFLATQSGTIGMPCKSLANGLWDAMLAVSFKPWAANWKPHESHSWDLRVEVMKKIHENISNHRISQISADPSRRDMEIFYAGSKRCRGIQIQNPKSKIQTPKSKLQNPKSKRRRLGPPQKEGRLNWSKIQNPKSQIPNPRSKIQDPKSKSQNPNSKRHNPRSKIQGWPGWGRRRWPCSKRRCMAVPAARIWPSW